MSKHCICGGNLGHLITETYSEFSLLPRQASDPVALHVCTKEHSVDDFYDYRFRKIM